MLATHQAPNNRSENNHSKNKRSGIPSRQQMLVIEPIGNSAESAPIVLLPGKCLIGSAPDCSLILHGDGVSTRH